VRVEAQPDEPVLPAGYRLERKPSLDQALVRDGFTPIRWQAVPKGEQVVIEKFRDYIGEISKPSATVRKG
jgi:hypothetical protein